MKAKQDNQPNQEKINSLLDLHKKGESILLEKEVAIELKKYPDFSFLHNLMGISMGNQRRYKESLKSFRLALNLSEDPSIILNNIGITEIKLGKFKEAITSLKESIKLNPAYSEAHCNLGNAYRKSGKIKQAVDSYTNCIKTDSSFFKAYTFKSLALKNLGDFDESIKLCKESIEIKEDQGICHRHLTSMRKYKTKSDTHIKQMESIYANKTLELEDKIQLAFGLGKAYEDLKDYAKAFEYLEEGNSLHRQRLKYSTSSRIKAFLDIKREFNHDFFNTDLETYSESNKMIFIIGMPRSGTSLVEQILSSHSKVHGAGELRFLRDSIEKIFHKEGNIFPNNIKEQDKKAFFLLAEDYLRRINSVAPINSKYVTDKMPYNFMHAGLISKSFPKAKIILCQRDPFDNCFSIYKQKFGTGNDYAYSLKEIGEYYNLYKDLIKHWDSVIPSKLFTVSYEDLIENQEKVSKNLIAHCNLEWEDECLSFHDTKREVLTASAVQVRKPIYKTSVNLWKKYGNNLELLRDLLKQER